MNDLAPASPHLYRRRSDAWRHLPRIGIFFLGLVLGVLAGYAFGRIPNHPEKPKSWDTASLTCSAFQDGRYFIHSNLQHDYRLCREACTLMLKTKAGLIPSEASLAGDFFLPSGENAAILIKPLPEEKLVVFDRIGKFRIDLNR